MTTFDAAYRRSDAPPAVIDDSVFHPPHRASRKFLLHTEGNSDPAAHVAADVTRVDEWDNWKSVRDVA
jgi:hypothetical protein